MELIVLGSSSSGNSYILQGKDSALVIDAGIRFIELKKAMDFNISKISACLSSHYHQDHSKYIYDYMSSGIRVGGHKSIFKKDSHFAVRMEHGKTYNYGGFIVMPFDLVHDTPIFGFLIEHQEMGKLVFITDSAYSKYKFPGVNHFLIEANYSQEILDANILSGRLPAVVRNRVMKSHMSLQTCKELLQANDLTNVINIVLLHLSDGNSNAKQFIDDIQGLTGKVVHIADKGLIIDLNKTEF